MTARERTKAAEAIAVTAEVCGRELSEAAGKFMLSELSEYRLPEVLEALRQCCRECKRGLFSLADVIERLPGRPEDMTADEAWGIALRSQLWDEWQTTVLPVAIQAAFPLEIWNEGDKVGARMAFKAAWERCVSDHGMDPRISLGYDSDTRASVIESALKDGIVSIDQARHALPGHDFIDDGRQIESKRTNELSPVDEQAMRQLIGRVLEKS